MRSHKLVYRNKGKISSEGVGRKYGFGPIRSLYFVEIPNVEILFIIPSYDGIMNFKYSISVSDYPGFWARSDRPNTLLSNPQGRS